MLSDELELREQDIRLQHKLAGRSILGRRAEVSRVNPAIHRDETGPRSGRRPPSDISGSPTPQTAAASRYSRLDIRPFKLPQLVALHGLRDNPLYRTRRWVTYDYVVKG